MFSLRLRLVLGLAVSAALLSAASCSETLPRSLDTVGADGADAGEAGPPPGGPDVRPVSTTCQGHAIPAPPVAPKARIAFEPLTKTPLNHLVDIVPHGDLIYVVDQSGYVRTIAKDGTVAQVLDMHDEVNLGYDSGLLSIAFHPKFDQNGFVYLAFTTPYPTQPPPDGTVFLSVLARFHSSDGGKTIERSSEKRILVRNQPTVNHQGNKVVFGPDGYLYFACGDGAKFDSPNGQDKNALFGKLLRLDVDNGDPYAIPPTNPFASGGGAPEVYALGFRNPWRFSIDTPTGEIWLGDVGQDTWEEIDKVVLGGNYGFAIKEGFSCFLAATCDSTGLIDPVVVHPHNTEANAIVGGVVYHGTKIPELTGKYVYGDNVQGHFWSIPTNVPAPVPVRLEEGLMAVNPSSFSLDGDGEIVFVTNLGGAYRIVAPPAPVFDMAPKLSGTGCVDAADPTKPAANLFHYDVNVPQWMDGTTADRFLSIPGDAQVGVKDHARLSLPPRSIAMRTLRAEGRVLETQFLMRRPDASWAAYTYAWSDDQKDAVLATAPVSIKLPSGREHVVAPAECVKCHDSASGPPREDLTIGLEAAQLDRAGVDYGNGRVGNPLLTLDHLGMLTAPVPLGSYEPLPDPFGSDDLGRRARGYLHANCASCHDGSIPDDIDLRYFTALKDTHTCRPGTLPSGGSAILAPGDIEMSQLFTSVRTAGAGRMPPVGSHVPDAAGVRLLSDWISFLQPADCQ
jgi:glucose/arabinose dehydrogenase